MKTLALYLAGLVGGLTVVATFVSHGLNGRIFREEQDLGRAMERLKTESPRSSFVVKLCYSLILLEFGAFLLYVVFFK